MTDVTMRNALEGDRANADSPSIVRNTAQFREYEARRRAELIDGAIRFAAEKARGDTRSGESNGGGPRVDHWLAQRAAPGESARPSSPPSAEGGKSQLRGDLLLARLLAARAAAERRDDTPGVS